MKFATERAELLAKYAAASRQFADSVERLLRVHNDVEAFILALDATGSAHRASEQARIRLHRSLARQ